MQSMTPDECRAFLLERAHTGKLATVRADSRPHIAPIWFTLDGDDLPFTTWHTAVKAVNIRRDGRLALCVDDDTSPFSYVIAEGTPTNSAPGRPRSQPATWVPSAATSTAHATVSPANS
ncbi:MAG TPA: pyridoxamine 5'-phosphate oxidase family protein [Thermomicrobiales bacterium]|jgi:PPOX class probable F420-dependent enzyme